MRPQSFAWRFGRFDESRRDRFSWLCDLFRLRQFRSWFLRNWLRCGNLGRRRLLDRWRLCNGWLVRNRHLRAVRCPRPDPGIDHGRCDRPLALVDTSDFACVSILRHRFIVTYSNSPLRLFCRAGFRYPNHDENSLAKTQPQICSANALHIRLLRMNLRPEKYKPHDCKNDHGEPCAHRQQCQHRWPRFGLTCLGRGFDDLSIFFCWHGVLAFLVGCNASRLGAFRHLSESNASSETMFRYATISACGVNPQIPG